MRLSFPSAPNLFPTYLTPSLPFRRRKTSTDSSTSSCSTKSSTSTSSTAEAYLTGHSSQLRCARCLSDLAPSTQIISKGFTGRHGRAYLVAPPFSLDASTAQSSLRQNKLPNLPNTFTHKPVARNLVTGAHTVSDISCAQCGSVLGWKYIAAEEEAQKYKVGKYILETKRICRSNLWEGHEEDAAAADTGNGTRFKSNDNDVEFDSQDEDECEDLFLGIWNPQTAAKRRQKRGFASRNE